MQLAECLQGVGMVSAGEKLVIWTMMQKNKNFIWSGLASPWSAWYETDGLLRVKDTVNENINKNLKEDDILSNIDEECEECWGQLTYADSFMKFNIWWC